MYFDSVAAALVMDGHGPYVWSAYGITLTVIALLVLLPIVSKRRLLRELRGEHRRNRQSESRSSVELS
ncbi:putative heme exporter protein CcmD [gamma proteobacterium NOR5-3]|jgi:heme exporter protein D|nr:putative heme exporter protein CcmD [gamma proteobacterium NOR5-3]